MADPLCSFLDFRSLTTNSNLHVFLPSKLHYSSALGHSHNSRINGMKRRPLHVTLLSKRSSSKPSSSEFDVISTHEHSDGSLLFRFGDPSEVAKNVKMEESKTEKEDKEKEAEDGIGLVKFLDSRHETEKMVRKRVEEVSSCALTEVSDHTNSVVVRSKSIIVEEGEKGPWEKLLEVSNDIELPVIVSSEEMEATSAPVVDIEHTGNVDGGLSEDHDGSSPADASDKNVDMGNNITTVELSEKETAEGNTLVSLMPDSDVVVPGNDVLHASLQTVVTTDVSDDSEHQNIETEMQNVNIEDATESVESDLVSPPPKSEPALSLSEEIEDRNLQAGVENLNDSPQNLILESERNEINDGVQTGDLVEASMHEVRELKSTKSVTNSEEISMPDFVLSSGAALLPHPSKVLTGGEDAYFIAGQTWLGVADGVGQWSLEGTKLGVYAQDLIKNCERLISNCNGYSLNNPAELLNLSVAETTSPGSSTVLIAHFDGQALHVANVGDSGFIILRHGVVYKRSSPMFHVFHFPQQIEGGDEPSSLAEFYRVALEEEDVIVIATDGLLDNLYDQEISSIIVKSLAADKKLEEIAELLATKAQEIGNYPSGRSPFADDAQATGFAGYTGGKLDDVAVIVSVVQRQSNSQTL